MDTKELKKARTVIKGELTTADRLVEELNNIQKEIINSRMKTLEDYCETFELLQLQKEMKTD